MSEAKYRTGNGAGEDELEMMLAEVEPGQHAQLLPGSPLEQQRTASAMVLPKQSLTASAGQNWRTKSAPWAWEDSPENEAKLRTPFAP